jgi:phosphatidylserine decarboxylase
MIAPYASRDAALIAVVGGLATLGVGVWLGGWAILPALLTLALLGFYRHPPRRIPSQPGLLLAPADGRIATIEQTRGPEGGRLRIVIFLSVFNVHVNRSPCAGRVVTSQHRPGKFINALKNEADDLNESHTIALEPVPPLPGPICVRQIAGALARRIVCAAQVGDKLAAGQHYGMIKLGSRTEVVVPDDGCWSIAVRTGQTARAGVTILAVHQAAPRGTIPTS